MSLSIYYYPRNDCSQEILLNFRVYRVAMTTNDECRPDARRNDLLPGSKRVKQPCGQEYELFVGVDMAAKTATIAWQRDGGPVGKPRTIEQTPEGFTRLAHALAATKVAPSNTLLAMEAPGAYWVPFATLFVR